MATSDLCNGSRLLQVAGPGQKAGREPILDIKEIEVLEMA